MLHHEAQLLVDFMVRYGGYPVQEWHGGGVRRLDKLKKPQREVSVAALKDKVDKHA